VCQLEQTCDLLNAENLLKNDWDSSPVAYNQGVNRPLITCLLKQMHFYADIKWNLPLTKIPWS